MSIAGLEAVQWENPLANELVVVIIHCYSQDCQVREDYLQTKNGTFPEFWKAAPKNDDSRNLGHIHTALHAPLWLEIDPHSICIPKAYCISYSAQAIEKGNWTGFLEIISLKILNGMHVKDH